MNAARRFLLVLVGMLGLIALAYYYGPPWLGEMADAMRELDEVRGRR